MLLNKIEETLKQLEEKNNKLEITFTTNDGQVVSETVDTKFAISFLRYVHVNVKMTGEHLWDDVKFGWSTLTDVNVVEE